MFQSGFSKCPLSHQIFPNLHLSDVQSWHERTCQFPASQVHPFTVCGTLKTSQISRSALQIFSILLCVFSTCFHNILTKAKTYVISKISLPDHFLIRGIHFDIEHLDCTGNGRKFWSKLTRFFKHEKLENVTMVTSSEMFFWYLCTNFFKTWSQVSGYMHDNSAQCKGYFWPEGLS